MKRKNLNLKVITVLMAACLSLFVTSGWSNVFILLPDNGDGNDGFSRSVSISNDYAVVGAPYDDDNGDNSGSVYVFQRTDITWTQQAKLIAADGGRGFGGSVSISGDYAIVDIKIKIKYANKVLFMLPK